MTSSIPEKFSSIILDFIEDLNGTFPEYKSLWWVYSKETSEQGWKDLYDYCLTIYPERFFDILYQNDEIFDTATKNTNTCFLPNVEFKRLYHCKGVSENTKNSIWKYLQLILFTIIGNVKDKSEFGDTMNIFEGINEEELQSKITEAMSGLTDFFKTMDKKMKTGDNDDDDHAEEEEEGDENENVNTFFKTMEEEMKKNFGEDDHSQTHDASHDTFHDGHSIPNPDDLHNHLKGLFGGKLGSLAKELMEELSHDLEETLGINTNEFQNDTQPADVFKKMMRNPDKFMKLIQKIQNKFQDKMKSGDLSQEDLMKEAGEMLRKMKEMGGNSKQMHEMFQNMAKDMGGLGGLGGMGGGKMRMDTGKLDRLLKSQDTKDRLRAKLEKRKEEAKYTLETTQNSIIYRPNDSEPAEKSKLSDLQIEELSKEFENAIEPSFRPATTNNQGPGKSNKKKSKKK